MIIVASLSIVLGFPIFSLDVQESADVLAIFPLEVGREMEYRATFEKAYDDNAGIEPPVTWTRVVSVTETFESEAGLLVMRAVEHRELNETALAELPSNRQEQVRTLLEEDRTEHLLINGNYIYSVPGWELEEESRTIHTRILKGLEDGTQTPEYFFPMVVRTWWAERVREEAEKDKQPTGLHYWMMNEKVSLDLPYGSLEEVCYLQKPSLGGGLQRWFKDGVGVVKETMGRGGSTNMVVTYELVAVR